MLDLMNPEERPEQIQRYGVYTIRTATEDGVVYSRSFIVVRNGYGVISRFTRLQDYAGFKVYKPISSNAEKKLYYICGMLNYVLVDNGRRFGIRHVFGITAEMLQAFAGLRAGEVCSVRQECSPLGRGITFTELGGRVVSAVVDVEQEIRIRDDDVEVGMIKKERRQGVYPAFLGAFCKAYELHREFLSGREFDRGYCPMFINRNGEAMTYETYRTRFRELVDGHLRPYLIKSSDPELRLYGQLLYENQLGTHALRHWFTVQLVLRGEDIGSIQYWRGDSSPESSFLYLQNKGDITRELEASSDRLVTMLVSGWGDFEDDTV